MAIRALAPWFGGKRTLAPRIVAELGKHAAYFEVCAGSMAVLMAKKPAPMEVVNDLHGDLINLARVVASARWAELAERLERTLMHDQIFLEAKGVCGDSNTCEPAPSVAGVEQSHVDRAYWFFVYSWMGRNGVSGTAATNITVATRFTSNGGSGGFRFRSAVQSLPGWHERLRHVQMRRGCAIEMAERIEDKAGTVIYADPPYWSKGAKYVHDFKPEDHARLATALKKKHTRVVVSYYDEPEIREIYAGWTLVRCPITKALTNQGTRGKSGECEKAPEIMLINGPSYTGGGLFA